MTNLSDIPRDGVYAWVVLAQRPSSPAPTWNRPLRLPPDGGRPHQIATQEGAPLPEYRFAGRCRGPYYADVRVDFGRRRPTRALLGRAQTLLAALRLPARLASGPGGC